MNLASDARSCSVVVIVAPCLGISGEFGLATAVTCSARSGRHGYSERRPANVRRGA